MWATGHAITHGCLSKFAIVKAPALLAVGVVPFASIFVPAAGNPADPRKQARITASSLEGDSRWLKEP